MQTEFPYSFTVHFQCSVNAFQILLVFFPKKNARDRETNYLNNTCTSSSVAPMSAARNDTLNVSGCRQDLNASSKAVDFSLSLSNFFRISMTVSVVKKVNKLRNA